MIFRGLFNRIGSRPMVFATLFVFFAITIVGLSKLSWESSLPWEGTDPFIRFFGFLLVVGVVFKVFSKFVCQEAIVIFFTMAGGLSLVSGTLWPIIVVGWFFASSAVLGYWVLHVIKSNNSNPINCILVGSGLYGTGVGLFARFNVNYEGVYCLLLALPLLIGWRLVSLKLKDSISGLIGNRPDEIEIDNYDISIAAIASVYFLTALMPELGFDSLTMHLFIPGQLALRHQWGFDAATYVWAVMPALGDWIFSIGYLLAGETAARLINVGYIFVVGFLVREIVLWAGGVRPAAKMAVLLFISTPLTFTEGSSLYIESIWAAFVVAGTLEILRVCSPIGKPIDDFPLIGVLLGCAVATKAVTLSILPVLLIVFIIGFGRLSFRNFFSRRLAFALAIFTLIGVVPYATAFVLTGNPVFPLFNKIFKSAYFVTAENFFNPLYVGGVAWDTIYRATFDSSKYSEASAGAPGFQWLLLYFPSFLVLVFYAKLRGLALFLVGTVSLIAVCYSQTYLRYVFPSIVILTATIGVAYSQACVIGNSMGRVFLLAVAFSVGLNLLFFNAGSFYRDFPTKAIWSKSSRDNYLMVRKPIRIVVELVNSLNIEGAAVAVFAEPLTAGLAADALYPSWYNFVFQREIAAANDEQSFADVLMNRGVTYIILDANWNGVNCCGDGKVKQSLVEKISETVASYGNLSVRRLKSDYRFKKELLGEPNFSGISSWRLASGAIYDAATRVITASETSPATQIVAVYPGRRYLNTVVERCAKEPSIGRVQINWLSGARGMIRSDINTFECSPTWATHSMEIVAPKKAVSAEVYVSGHSSIPLEFKGNSLLQ